MQPSRIERFVSYLGHLYPILFQLVVNLVAVLVFLVVINSLPRLIEVASVLGRARTVFLILARSFLPETHSSQRYGTRQSENSLKAWPTA